MVQYLLHAHGLIGRAGASPPSRTTGLNFLYICITQYGSTVYIGIAMVFVFPHTLGKFSSYFQFQVNSTSDDYTV